MLVPSPPSHRQPSVTERQDAPAQRREAPCPSSGISRSLLSVLAALVEVKSGDVPKSPFDRVFLSSAPTEVVYACKDSCDTPRMEHLDWVLFRSWRGNIYSLDLINATAKSATVALTSAGSQPPASQVASKDAAPATPQSSPAVRAPANSARPSRPPAASEPAAPRCPATAQLNHRAPPPPPSIRRTLPPAQPLAPSASSAPAAHQMPGQPPAQPSAPPSSWRRTPLRPNPLVQHPRRRPSQRLSMATPYGPSGLPQMPGLPFAGGRQERARPESCRHLRQEIG